MAISHPLLDLPLPADFPRHVVPRERLVGRLDAREVPVALVVAAAGHGKSTAVAQWAEHDPRPTAWVCLGGLRAQSAPDVLRAIADALDEHEPSDAPADVSGVLARLRDPRSLVLDDVHALHSADALAAVSELADRMPAASRLTIVSRGVPALPLGRLRARRRMVELGWSDLVMTPSEAYAALRLAGIDAATDAVDALVRRTEGWPAAIDLAAACASETADRTAALRTFTGEDRLFGDYVRDEVLADLDPAHVDFLVRTSLLDRLSGPLCDAVLCRSDSAQVLHELSRSTGLLLPLDRGDRWYRHHRLFGEALRARLAVTDPAFTPTGHARASRWHAGAAEIEAAVVHAAAAGDAGAAGDLLFDNVTSYVASAGGDLVSRWIARFSPAEVRESPALALAAATSAWTAGELDRAEHLATVAEAAMHTGERGPRFTELRAGALVMRAAVGRDGLTQMAADAARAARVLPEHSGWLARSHLFEGVALQLLGRDDEALVQLQAGARRASVGAPDVRALCLAQLALLADRRGAPEDAAILASRARAHAETGRRTRCPTDALLLAVSAMTLAERGLVDEAATDLRDATALLGQLVDFVPWYEVEVRVSLARAELRLSDVGAAKAHLHEAARILRPVADAGVLPDVVEAAWARTDAYCAAAAVAPALTRAELRVLRLLPTHLSFGEIAERLFVSANTIKTQAHAVYRKLDATSRSAAVARGRELGLLDG